MHGVTVHVEHGFQAERAVASWQYQFQFVTHGKLVLHVNMGHAALAVVTGQTANELLLEAVRMVQQIVLVILVGVALLEPVCVTTIRKVLQ